MNRDESKVQIVVRMMRDESEMNAVRMCVYTLYNNVNVKLVYGATALNAITFLFSFVS